MNQTPLIKTGQKIVFVGDSLTEAPDGYVKVFENMISALAPSLKLTYINAGVSGNRAPDVLERISEDVIAHDPDWITLSIGINDVWHGVNGTPIDRFKDCYGEVVRRLQKQTVAKLALFTTTVIGEDLESDPNRMLISFNDFIRETAIKCKALLVPMNEEFHKTISAWQKVADDDDYRYTIDGVHMLPAGNYLMALTLLKAWGIL
jgi:lysophospholipase L1-like esterase